MFFGRPVGEKILGGIATQTLFIDKKKECAIKPHKWGNLNRTSLSEKGAHWVQVQYTRKATGTALTTSGSRMWDSRWSPVDFLCGEIICVVLMADNWLHIHISEPTGWTAKRGCSVTDGHIISHHGGRWGGQLSHNKQVTREGGALCFTISLLNLNFKIVCVKVRGQPAAVLLLWGTGFWSVLEASTFAHGNISLALTFPPMN